MSSLSQRRRHRVHRTLLRRFLVVNILRIISFGFLCWGEYLVFWSAASCQWPDHPLEVASSQSSKRSHVLLLSDPQVKHPLSFWDSFSFIHHLKHAIFVSHLQRSWNSVKALHPDVIIFLGDMLAHGKYSLQAPDFDAYWREFHRIFPLPSQGVYYLPGNNDVGMGTDQYSTRSVRTFFQRRFGPFNQALDIQNHTFVLLDAPGLVDEDYRRSASRLDFDQHLPESGGPIDFVKSLSTSQPVVLLSHIPLYRPDLSFCGPFRERGTLRKGVGHGYQNTLGKQTTQFLLQTLRPAYIFSGDDRDYCEHTHNWYTEPSDPVSRAREVTIKSFSLAKNIRKPGFQLLTVVPPPHHDAASLHPITLADRPCFLPDQYAIYTSIYGPVALLTFFILLAVNYVRARHLQVSSPGIPPIETSRRSDELSPLPGGTSPSGTPILRAPHASTVWSPYHIPVPVSPRSSLPPTLRTPNTSSVGPNLRAASRPSTPSNSSLLPQVPYIPDDEDDDHHLSISQYATQRHPHAYDNDWTPGHEPYNLQQQQQRTDGAIASLPSHSPFFLPAPGSKASLSPSRVWSWTFVFRGRRRRMTIRAPPSGRFLLYVMWSALKSLPSALVRVRDTDSAFLQRGIILSSCRDWFAVYLPLVLCWLLMLWWDA